MADYLSKYEDETYISQILSSETPIYKMIRDSNKLDDNLEINNNVNNTSYYSYFFKDTGEGANSIIKLKTNFGTTPPDYDVLNINKQRIFDISLNRDGTKLYFIYSDNNTLYLNYINTNSLIINKTPTPLKKRNMINARIMIDKYDWVWLAYVEADSHLATIESIDTYDNSRLSVEITGVNEIPTIALDKEARLLIFFDYVSAQVDNSVSFVRDGTNSNILVTNGIVLPDNTIDMKFTKTGLLLCLTNDGTDSSLCHLPSTLDSIETFALTGKKMYHLLLDSTDFNIYIDEIDSGINKRWIYIRNNKLSSEPTYILSNPTNAYDVKLGNNHTNSDDNGYIHSEITGAVL